MHTPEDTAISTGTSADPPTGWTPTPAPRRRRRRPAVLAFAALGISAAAVTTGAAVSASAMPDATPRSADVVTLGSMSGAGAGFECTFTGKEAAALDAQIFSTEATTEAVPATGSGATPSGASGASGSATVGAVPAGGEVPDGAAVRAGIATVDLGGSPPPEGGSVVGADGVPVELTPTDVSGTSGATATPVRAGTKAECDSLVKDATDGKR